jgi:hypothetical protein
MIIEKISSGEWYLYRQPRGEKKSKRNWFIIRENRFNKGILKIGAIILPKEFIGKKIRIKIEVYENVANKIRWKN